MTALIIVLVVGFCVGLLVHTAVKREEEFQQGLAWDRGDVDDIY